MTAAIPSSVPRLRRRRGVALVMVVMVTTIAFIMGYALLASSTMQALVAGNMNKNAIATNNAEAGISMAMYYLMNPANMPNSSSGYGSYYAGWADVTFGSLPGSATVTVTQVSSQSGLATYDIRATGISSGTVSAGAGVTAVKEAYVKVTKSYLIKQAMGSNCPLITGSNTAISGNPTAVISNGSVNNSLGEIDGNVYSTLLVGSIGGSWYAAPSTPAAPSSANIKSYMTYTYNGATYNATVLPSSNLSNVTLPASPIVGNPGAVYYYNGDVTFSGGVHINGTLLCRGGKLSIQGTNNSISANANLPALVVDNSLEINGILSRSISITGVVWLGQGITVNSLTGGLLGSISINGALLVDQGNVYNGVATAITPADLGSVSVQYVAANANVPDLCSANQTPISIKVTTWFP